MQDSFIVFLNFCVFGLMSFLQICLQLNSGRESLHSLIKRLYGEDMSKLLRRLEVLRKKKAQLLCSLTFLLRCRDSSLIPKFLRVKRVFNSTHSQRIYNRTEKALLRERIHQNRRDLAHTDQELLTLSLRMGNSMHWSHWDKIDRLTAETSETTFIISTNRQKKKFDNLQNFKSVPAVPATPDMSRTVINLTERELTSEETSVLSKGGNFSITPDKVPVEDIIANVESGIRALPRDVAEEIRIETFRILRNAKTPKSNITTKEKKAIKNLNADKDILILAADKGNATVVMKTDDYKEKIKNLLDPVTYKKLKHDPTTTILRKTNQLIRASSIEPDIKKNLCSSEALTPRLYGLPKIHKENLPLRPIVSAIGSPTYHLAKYLTTLLNPFIGRTDSYIRDSTHFIEKIKNISLGPNDILVSFDVVSLFTMVPVNQALQYINENFSNDIATLFRHCLTTTYFQWDKEFYEQTDGVAMGSPLSPVIANFFMEKFEQQALNLAKKKPSCWFRYVDDTFVVWSHGPEELNNFLTLINSINTKIQFTMETETNREIAFLDVLVKRKPNGTLGHKVYRKPTHTDRYLNARSNHHPRQKQGVIKTLTERAKRICEPKHLQAELRHLEKALQKNGYALSEIKRATHPRKITSVEKDTPVVNGKAFLPYVKNVTDRIGKILKKHNVKPIYKPTKTIQQSLRSAKDPRDPLSTPGVYRIPCTCGSVYVGTTKRSVKTRITEHKRNCRYGHTEKSAVAEHTLSQDNHRIMFEETQVLDKTLSYHARLYREAIEIHKHPTNFNRKEEGVNLSKTWTLALRKAKPLPMIQHMTQAMNHTMNQTRIIHENTEATPTNSIKAAAPQVNGSFNDEKPGRILRPLPHRL